MIKNSRIETIEQATGITWDEWLKFMDEIGAKDLSHHEIAKHVQEYLTGKHASPGWWSQSVTVAYEQYIGRRLPGQTHDGKFQSSVSRATNLGIQELMDSWENFASSDKEVQDTISSNIRSSGTEKRLSWRTKYKSGASLIIVSEPKTNNTASIIMQHTGSKSAEDNERNKEKWTKIIERFVSQL